MKINFAGIIDGPEEYEAVKRAMDSKWHGPGQEADAFEKEFAEYVGAKYCLMTNSGSSANLLALKALKLPFGSKVLTSGCGFPATLNPILHLGLQPVLVDYDSKSQNIDIAEVKKAIKEDGNIYAAIFAHTMGNPVNMYELLDLNIPVIEDCCEALGSKLNHQHVGTFGHVGTFSFYPSHQMNGLGGGGCIVTDDEELAIEARSLRNWGKLVTEPSFAGDHVTDYANSVAGIPYDSQYTYQTVGFNMQPTDVQAAYLREQLKRLPDFVARRDHNWNYIFDGVKDIKWMDTMQVLPCADPSYFGFTMVLAPHVDRDNFSAYLEAAGVRGRPFFAGNVTKHEPYKFLANRQFPVADFLMKKALFIGVWPGITDEQLEYIVNKIKDYDPEFKVNVSL